MWNTFTQWSQCLYTVINNSAQLVKSVYLSGQFLYFTSFTNSTFFPLGHAKLCHHQYLIFESCSSIRIHSYLRSACFIAKNAILSPSLIQTGLVSRLLVIVSCFFSVPSLFITNSSEFVLLSWMLT